MRIRSIHPEFWRSEDVAGMDWETRLIFIGLWSYVDDNGVGRDVEKLIVAELFPLEDDPRDTLATVSRALRTLSEGGQITRYYVDSKPLLHITNWNKWQKIDRPGKTRYEPPTSGNAAIRETVATPSRDPRETPSTGEGEKGRRGEDTSPSADAEDRFNEFWAEYPRKVSKKNARIRWDKLLKDGTDPDQIIAGAIEYAGSVRGKLPEHIKHPDGWLNGERWTDEPPSLVGAAKSPASMSNEELWA
jgi:hypothetical protein